MNNLFVSLEKNLILCSIFICLVGCRSDDKIVETKLIDGLTIIKTEDLKSKNVILEFLDENHKKVSRYLYGDGFTICDTNISYRNKINEYPNEIEVFDKRDSVVSEIKCIKIGEGILERNGKSFIYDCNRIEYDPERRIKGGFDYGPGYTTKAIKYVGHFKINQNCNGSGRTSISDIEYDYDRKRIKKRIYNQNGVIESVSYFVYPQEKIYEKKLYIDGEYIKTKCFSNLSLNVEAKEIIDEKGSCVE